MIYVDTFIEFPLGYIVFCVINYGDSRCTPGHNLPQAMSAPVHNMLIIIKHLSLQHYLHFTQHHQLPT